jgi:hypothetical protein
MSTILTLSQLRIEIGTDLGETDCTGTITSPPGGTITDNQRWDLDGTWNMGWLQDLTVPGGSIVRIKTWSQSINQFALFNNPNPLAATGDQYEVHKVLSFEELRRAINRGLATCGEGLRVLVRDESQVFVAAQYQYKPNYNATQANAFFPQGVMRLDVQWDLGQPTAPWVTLTDWEYIDDETIQVSYSDADYYAGNPIRFVGYGPITKRITTDAPATVIGTFDDDFQIEVLHYACTHHAWLIAAAKKSSNESQEELQMAQMMLAKYEDARKKWNRPQLMKRRIKVPTGVGWTAGRSS